MAAYFIVRCKYHDMDDYKKYANAAAQAVKAFNGRFLVAGKGNQLQKEKGMGLAKEIFNNENMKLLAGNIGISHNRYPTHGGFSHGEVQPFWTSVPYGCLLYTSPSPRAATLSRMPSSA